MTRRAMSPAAPTLRDLRRGRAFSITELDTAERRHEQFQSSPGLSTTFGARVRAWKAVIETLDAEIARRSKPKVGVE